MLVTVEGVVVLSEGMITVVMRSILNVVDRRWCGVDGKSSRQVRSASERGECIGKQPATTLLSSIEDCGFLTTNIGAIHQMDRDEERIGLLQVE